jgi:hypothetical protein
MPMQSPHVSYQAINGNRCGRSFERAGGAKNLGLVVGRPSYGPRIDCEIERPVSMRPAKSAFGGKTDIDHSRLDIRV